jgi:Na+/H+ antiporter NhaA
MRAFLRTEAGSSGVLAGAIVAALLWANVAPESYESFWHAEFSLRLGPDEFGLSLREWINGGLMTLFFLVVGLELRREFDLGDLRDRSRFVLPLIAGVAGMVLPALIYLAFNLGGEGAHGWGAAMSTDTALALGLLALVGRGVPDRIRVFLLSVFIVDDILALVVIAVVYSEDIAFMPLLMAIVGKPVAVIGASWLIARSTRGRLRPLVGWAGVAGSGTIAGIGFTVSLLIATIAFEGPQLVEAKLGLLSAVVVSSVLTWLVFRVAALLAPPKKAVACCRGGAGGVLGDARCVAREPGEPAARGPAAVRRGARAGHATPAR